MAPDMRVSGKMICKKVMVQKYGVMVQSIQATIKKARSMVMEYIIGWTNPSMKATGLRIK